MCNINNVKYEFQLSGLGDAALENKVYEAVQQAGYSKQELFDIREPVQYSFFELTNNIDNYKKKLLMLKQMASLSPDIAIPSRITNIKALFKKFLAKFIKWYVEPIFNSQSGFNFAASSFICELVFTLQTQEETIKRLQKELNEMKRKNV